MRRLWLFLLERWVLSGLGVRWLLRQMEALPVEFVVEFERTWHYGEDPEYPKRNILTAKTGYKGAWLARIAVPLLSRDKEGYIDRFGDHSYGFADDDDFIDALWRCWLSFQEHLVVFPEDWPPRISILDYKDYMPPEETHGD